MRKTPSVYKTSSLKLEPLMRSRGRAVLIIASLALAMLVPSVHAQAPEFVSPPPPIPPEQWAVEYSKSAGLSYEEALHRVRIQQRVGGLVTKLQEQLGDRFAGVWIDPANGSIRVGSTTAQDRQAIVATVTSDGYGNDASVVDVASTRSDLDAVQHTLSVELAQALASGHVSSYVDDQDNRVVVNLAPAATANERARARNLRDEFAAGRMTYDPPKPPLNPSPVDGSMRRAILPAEPVRRKVTVVLRDVPQWQAQSTACSTESCGLPLRAGVKIFADSGSSRSLCSAGFIGTWWSGSSTYFYNESAGHCMYEGVSTTWKAYDVDAATTYAVGYRNSYRYGTTPGNPSYLPTFDAGNFSMDYGLHWTNILAPVLWMHGWPGGEYWGVTGQAVAVQNEYGCRTGFASAYTCGTVTSTNFSVSYGGINVTNLVLVPNACPVPGDSGGAFIDGGTALGITSGRLDSAGSCSGMFAHVWDISYWLGINVWH